MGHTTESDATLLDVCYRIYQHLDSPISLSCWIMLKSGDHRELAAKAISPNDYLDTTSGAKRFARDYQAVRLLRKYEELATGKSEDDLVDEAIAAFVSGEERCAATNSFLREVECEWGAPALMADDLLRFRKFLRVVKKRIGRLFGPVDQATLVGRFGPGTPSELTGAGTYVTVPDKLSYPFSSTCDNVAVFRHLTSNTNWEFRRSQAGLWGVSLTPGNVFTTVPKTALSRRGIAQEPGCNVFTQLAIGAHFKRKLAKRGIMVQKSPHLSVLDRSDSTLLAVSHDEQDLTNALVAAAASLNVRTVRPGDAKPWQGQEIHRWLALQASRSDEWCTLDLRNASNSQCYELVKAVVPCLDDKLIGSGWFELLDSCRSPMTYVKGEWRRTEMFSSMGNGFTFELMTAILGCLLEVAFGLKMGETVFVYGDDIVIPVKHAIGAAEMLRLVGFEINTQKSYWAGPFRESCGMDAFYGYDVTPAMLKVANLRDIDAIYGFHNVARARGALNLASSSALIDLLPSDLRLYGPEHIPNCLHGYMPCGKYKGRVRMRTRTGTRLTKRKIGKNFHPIVDWSCPQIKWIRTLVAQQFYFEPDRWDDWVALTYAGYSGSSRIMPRNPPRGEVVSFVKGWASVN